MLEQWLAVFALIADRLGWTRFSDNEMWDTALVAGECHWLRGRN